MERFLALVFLATSCLVAFVIAETAYTTGRLNRWQQLCFLWFVRLLGTLVAAIGVIGGLVVVVTWDEWVYVEKIVGTPLTSWDFPFCMLVASAYLAGSSLYWGWKARPIDRRLE